MEKTERMLSLVEQWRGSGMTQKEFCMEAGIKLGTFSYWVSRSRENEKGFMPLMPEKNNLTKEVELTYPNGVKIKIPSGDLKTLAQLIRLY